jgi:F-type H+-transporting ATPase subunit delta
MSASRTSDSQLAARYATAIFALATDAKKADLVVEELSALAAAIEGSEELRSALKSPLIGAAKKQDVLQALTKGAHKLTTQAIATIAEGGRTAQIPAIAEALRAKLAEAKGELVATVESARPLPASVQQQLAESLSKATGKTVQLSLKENPELLGGVAVQIGSQRLDASLSAALSTMRRDLLASNA